MPLVYVKKQRIHPVPLRCKLFGHWKAPQSKYGAVIVTSNECDRKNCYGDDHDYDFGDHLEDGGIKMKCRYPGCGIWHAWYPPDMSMGLGRAS